jgi:cold shock CspA family protein
MKLPIQITFRGIAQSGGLYTLIQEQASALDQYYSGIMRCRVSIEVPHRHHQEGNRYHVRIALTVPGEEIVVAHGPSLYPSLRDVKGEEMARAADLNPVHQYGEVAIREAFDIARRRLQDYARRQRGAVKHHEEPLHGTVVRVRAEEGWIQASDGREVYFHEHSVLDGGFAQLDVGNEVAFVEETGEKGLQASTVRLLGKHHYA